MDITQSNFWVNLPVVLDTIAGADFIAIDLEMTGVKRREDKILRRPSPEDIYQQARRGAETFQVLQVGLTCARYDGVRRGEEYIRCNVGVFDSS
jgi:poly(A)-specific ribonuclease